MSRRRRVRFSDLGGRWADEHGTGFPWYGVHPAWWILFIIPGVSYGAARILRGAWGQKSLPVQQQAQG